MFPQWSHDGKRIVFTSDRDDDPEIYVMNVDGSNPVRLTHSPGRDAHPYFSRDGRRIVFQSPRANGQDTNIYVMNSDGSNVAQLTRLKGFAGVPEKPDGCLAATSYCFPIRAMRYSYVKPIGSSSVAPEERRQSTFENIRRETR